MAAAVTKRRKPAIKSLSKHFFWILLAGVVFFFGLLIYVILHREKAIILDIYREKSLQLADTITADLSTIMLLESRQEIIEHIRAFNRSEGVRVGVVGPDGSPAFTTDISVPKEIFASQRETDIITAGEMIFYRPLRNSERCRQCHKAADKTRGMLVVKTSLKKADAEIGGTARRLLLIALFLGLASEFFLLFVLRKKILAPLEKLAEGANLLKSGKLEHRVDIKSNDEIGALASCFNEMAESIEKSHTHLENAVMQRTRELRAISQFSDAVIDNVGSGLLVMDREGRILKINEIGANFFKLDSADAAGRKLPDVYPETLDMLSISPGFNREFTLALPDGDTVPIGFSNSPLFDAAGNQTGIIVLFKDLTEIKKLQAALERKQHFEAMGKVIAGVAHEIRNPLFGISAVAQILEREITAEQHSKLLQALIREVHRLNNLVNELLLYSRPSKLNITEIDFSALCDRLRQYVDARTDTATLTLTADAGTVIRADADKITQVFLNLIDNAIGSGGTNIDVSASRSKEDGVIISIRDNGSGIKEEDMKKVFDPFFTTKKEGTGLGLSISKKIMQDHGGDIELISTQGHGTTAILHFAVGDRSA